jgi:hypothetical protein
VKVRRRAEARAGTAGDHSEAVTALRETHRIRHAQVPHGCLCDADHLALATTAGRSCCGGTEGVSLSAQVTSTAKAKATSTKVAPSAEAKATSTKVAPSAQAVSASTKVAPSAQAVSQVATAQAQFFALSPSACTQPGAAATASSGTLSAASFVHQPLLLFKHLR